MVESLGVGICIDINELKFYLSPKIERLRNRKRESCPKFKGLFKSTQSTGVHFAGPSWVDINILVNLSQTFQVT
jgi:hypothetical protein